MRDTLRKIERAITGESMSGAKGLVSRMSNVENRLETLESFKNRMLAQFTAVLAVVYAIMEIITRFVI